MRQLAGAGLLLLAALAAVLTPDLATLVVLLTGGLVLNFRAARSLALGLRRLAPILIFAGLLASLQWLGGGAEPRLALKTIAVFTLVVPAVRLICWDELLASRQPGSALFGVTLFLLVVRHFVRVLAGEAWRLLMAQNLASPRRWRHGWWGSLVWALAALFRRALLRAERFYAAQLVRGLGS